MVLRFNRLVSIAVRIPTVDDLERVAVVLGGWQRDEGSLQLHPGDLGWYSRKGAAATASALRIWSAGNRILAVGLLDGPQLLRMAVDPEHARSGQLARQLMTDVDDPQAGVLDTGHATIETRGAERFSGLLVEHGWQLDELWTPLRRDLSNPVPATDVRVEIIGSSEAEAFVEVHSSAFRDTPLTREERSAYSSGWRTMTTGPFRASARTLAAFDDHGEAVAVVTVWSAGPGRPGLVEPMGVHRHHRGRGYGTAITVAAASALREMGASSAVVGAESSNLGAVATYLAAGFTAGQQVADLRRTA